MSKINQRVDATICFQIDAATIAAVTAIRATTWNIFFTPETDTTVPAISGAYLYGCFVNKFHRTEN
jgi:hypothetical protein